MKSFAERGRVCCAALCLGLSATSAWPVDKPAVPDTLPDRVDKWKRWTSVDFPFTFYGRNQPDLQDVLGPADDEFREVTGSAPAHGIVFVLQHSSDATKLLAALQETGQDAKLAGEMDFGDDLSLEQALSMVPIPVPAEVTAMLLGRETSDLHGMAWCMAVPSSSFQKKAMKDLFKRKMKEEDINLAMRLLIRPFLGKMTTMALDALRPAAQVSLFEQWLQVTDIPEPDKKAHVQRFLSRLEEETAKKTDAMAQELEASAREMEIQKAKGENPH